MFKKIVIADRLALFVNAVYENPANFPATSLLLATFFFAFQIYCDFSGYSDIAIGCARVLGFDLMTNFRQPYFARSVTGFWRNWHISLTSWFKDYVYVPLGGNRKGFIRQCLNILIVFAVSGLWHGAAWHFVVWGILHGIFQVAERCWGLMFRKTQLENTLVKTLQMIITFIVVCLTWIFFRANSISDAFIIFGKFTALPVEIGQYITQLPQNGIADTVRNMFQLGSDVANPITGFGLRAFSLSCIVIAVLITTEIATRKTAGTIRIMRLPLAVRWALYYGLIYIVFLSLSQTGAQFIYFAF
jgi:D-alanyl-lipoteichoic acid acyltransferase DltB (MBOAT superfamily)